MDDIPKARSRHRAMQARAALLREDYASAWQLAQQAVAERPDDPSLHALCGHAAAMAGRHPQAAKHYQKASDLDPLNFSYYLASQRYSPLRGSPVAVFWQCAAVARRLVGRLSARDIAQSLTSWRSGRYATYGLVAFGTLIAGALATGVGQPQLLPFIGASALAAGLLACLWVESCDHRRRLAEVPIRVHVNGIRGKSTVTRMVAAVLRCRYPTLAKTTGSKPCMILPTGDEIEIRRRGPANIKEQIVTIREHAVDVDGLVIECMAVNPEFQVISERDMVQSTIGVITNVREDHQDVMGLTLRDIAESIGSTAPHVQPGFARGGYLVTTETRHLTTLADICQARGTTLLYVDPEEATDEDVARFPYMAFKENVALGLAFARFFHIPREQALDAMVQAKPDVGAVFVREISVEGKTLRYAPLWAVNDRESAVACVSTLREAAPGYTTVLILNNRADRQLRTVQFADIASQDIDPDYIMTIGDMRDICVRQLRANGFSDDRILPMNGQPVEGIVRRLLEITPERALVIPTVNIHTAQAHGLREWFHDEM
jgi:poly-gamma-glutamate synthase PgsB/CapB